MTDDYAPEEIIKRIVPLTPERLRHFESLRIITPVTTDEGPRYRTVDIRRITLLCELTDDFEVNEDALVIIMSLLDQLQLHLTKVRDIGFEELRASKARFASPSKRALQTRLSCRINPQ